MNNENIDIASIYLTYSDGDTVDVSIRSDGLNDFFDAIENGRPYVDTITNCGFYAPKAQIRYISFKITPYDSPQEPESGENAEQPLEQSIED